MERRVTATGGPRLTLIVAVVCVTTTKLSAPFSESGCSILEQTLQAVPELESGPYALALRVRHWHAYLCIRSQHAARSDLITTGIAVAHRATSL